MSSVFNPYNFDLKKLIFFVQKFKDTKNIVEFIEQFNRDNIIQIVAYEIGYDGVTFIFYTYPVRPCGNLPPLLLDVAWRIRSVEINFETDAFVVLSKTLRDPNFYFTDDEITYAGYIIMDFSAN